MILDCRDLLRIDDNPGLWLDNVVPVWVMPSAPMSPRRQRFLLQAVAALRAGLRARGSDLLIRFGDRVDVLTALAAELGCGVACARPSGVDELHQDAQIPGLVYLDARTLYGADDLPFSATPEPFTRFRKVVEKQLDVSAPVDAPARLPAIPARLAPGELPSLPVVDHDPRAYRDYRGGEDAAQAELAKYFSGTRAAHYKQTRNAMHGYEGSTKFSPWLAQGSLSPRRIWHRVTQYEQQVTKNDSTYWIQFELLWREFFQWWLPEQGPGLFGRRELAPAPRDFARWCAGDTGVPMIDANMRELNATGYMSNRGRQNVASFLSKDLGIDWRLGADYFETQLIDYDVASNWGNWAYVAGTGADPRDDRWFNVLLQGTRYDRRGDYVRHWVPALAGVDPSCAHWPWRDGGARPIVHPPRWNSVIDA